MLRQYINVSYTTAKPFDAMWEYYKDRDSLRSMLKQLEAILVHFRLELDDFYNTCSQDNMQ